LNSGNEYIPSDHEENTKERTFLHNQNTINTRNTINLFPRNILSSNITNYIKLNPTSQTNCPSASQVLRYLELKKRSNYHFHNMQPDYPNLWQINRGNIRTQAYLT
jgi:hypothetical protein